MNTGSVGNLVAHVFPSYLCLSHIPITTKQRPFHLLQGQDLLKLLEGRHPAALQQVRASSAISVHREDHQMASTESCRRCGLQTFTLIQPHEFLQGLLGLASGKPMGSGSCTGRLLRRVLSPKEAMLSLSFPGGAPTAPLLCSLSMQQVDFSSSYPWPAFPLPHDLLSMAGLV